MKILYQKNQTWHNRRLFFLGIASDILLSPDLLHNDEKLKAAADQLGLDWEKVLNGEDTIPTNLVKNETENTSA